MRGASLARRECGRAWEQGPAGVQLRGVGACSWVFHFGGTSVLGEGAQGGMCGHSVPWHPHVGCV